MNVARSADAGCITWGSTPNLRSKAGATRPSIISSPSGFFGRSANRKGALTEPVFTESPWGNEKQVEVFCYDCHRSSSTHLARNYRFLCTLVTLMMRGGAVA
jgi:hypothetical protein